MLNPTAGAPWEPIFSMSLFCDALSERVLIGDGAMGTAIHALDLPLDDFEGLEGCNEILSVTRPEVVREIHQGFLRVGCDFVETNAFGANRIVLAEYGIAERTHELSLAAARCAREAVDAYSTPDQPRFAVGNLGPGTKLPSLGHTDFDTLAASYAEQTRGLLDGGVDALIVETCQDLLQAKAALAGIDDACGEHSARPPVLVSVTVETTGTMLVGSEIGAALAALVGYDIQAIGLNCATGPREMTEHLRYLAEHSPLPISVMPNAGLPQLRDGAPYFPLQPDELAEWLERFVDEFGASIVGGCCGTTPEHLAAVVERLGRRPAKPRTVDYAPSLASLYQRTTIEQENSFLIIGERCNTTGSKRFRDLVEAGDLDGMVAVAREQVRGGAQVLDVCVDYVGRDGPADMARVIDRFATAVQVPLMVDSTETPVLEVALKRLGGRCAINSINLENGLEKPAAVLPLARRYNAAVVALTIDEEGMARGAERKVAIARRIYDLAVGEYGLSPTSLLFDALTLPVSTGIAEDRRNGLETIDGIRRIKETCPGAWCVLGVSNVSFGLKPAARAVLNSVFLHECMAAGLDAAIVHAGRITPLYKIDEPQREAALDLIYDRRREGFDPLTHFVTLFDDVETTRRRAPERELSLEEDLARRIVDGDRVGLEPALDSALAKYDALTIINDHLLAGMKTVGELFGSGQMQLPFVLQSAEVMKAAVGYLEPHMERAGGSTSRGTMVLATVKGDVHDIGKNLVDIILTNNGYRVVNLGIKQPIDAIVEAALEHQADVIGLSGLLVKSTLVMRDDLDELNRRGLDYFPVVLGGAALTRSYVEDDLRQLYRGEVYYGQDAFEGLATMDRLCRPEARQARRARLRERYAAGGARDEAPAAAEPIVTAQANGQAGRSDVATDAPLATPPFWGARIRDEFDLNSLFEYVNPLALYGGQYRLRRRHDESRDEWSARVEREIGPDIARLREQVAREGWFQPRAIYGYWPAAAEGNEVVLYDGEAELARLAFPRQPGGRRLCIADFYRPVESGERDVFAAMLVTLGPEVRPVEQRLHAADRYTEYLYFHGLAAETTEALAEYLHAAIRAECGAGGDDAAEVAGLFRQEYRGARYSYGYPACPNLEDQAKLFELLRPERIGVELSEEYQLVPEVSTTAVITFHPEARYFGVELAGGVAAGSKREPLPQDETGG